VQTLRVSWQFAKSIAHTIFEEVDDDFGMGSSQVLSVLISVFLQGQNTETIEKLSATLRTDGQLVIISSNGSLDRSRR
jgi:hypothetical protein